MLTQLCIHNGCEMYTVPGYFSRRRVVPVLFPYIEFLGIRNKKLEMNNVLHNTLPE
jgi:hypothetical protein